jgi:hypothetical protein
VARRVSRKRPFIKITLFLAKGLAIEIEARENLIGSICLLEINETLTPASSLLVES